MPAKKERIECTDLSLACPLPEATANAEKRPADVNQVDPSKRSCVNELPIVPWSALLKGKNEILKWTKKCNKRNTAPVREMSNCCLSGLHYRMTRMRSCGVSCWTVARVIEEWNGENDDHQDVTKEHLVQGVARQGNERGANVHENP